jgi:hypothetical protein
LAKSTEVRNTSETGSEKCSKPERFDLLPWRPLEEVARCFAAGSAKYSDHNWRRGHAWSLSYAALIRHLALFWEGEECDPETGTHHLAAATFHCLTLIMFTEEQRTYDDRPRTEAS